MTFFNKDDKSIRYVGRWYEGTATACGSFFEIYFKGEAITLEFDTSLNVEPAPHIYLCMDDGVMTEAVIGAYMRVVATEGEHKLTVIYKSAVEMQNRWYAPLQGKVAFKGYHADEAIEAPKGTKKIIEFVGDSITEGVLVDPDNRISDEVQPNRAFEDDSTATYAWRSAKALGLEPIIMGYGAVGVSKPGCGSVPAAPDAYPYCFENAPIPNYHPDYVFINHGTNDHFIDKEGFEKEYKRLIDTIFSHHPDTEIICMKPFGEYRKDSFPSVVEDYNRETGRNVHYIDTTGWNEGMPTHPTREGHKILGEHIVGELRKIIQN